MTNLFRAVGQGIPDTAEGAERWRDRFFSMPDEDRDEFIRYPSARFIIRERKADEATIGATFTDFRPGARRLLTVYRSGHRDPYEDAPGWMALRKYIFRAEGALLDCPALGADASYDASPRSAMIASPLVSGFAYIDAPGTMSFCLDHARVFKQFDGDAIDVSWKNFIAGYQRLVDHHRGFDCRRLSHIQGDLLFPRELLIR